MPSGGALASLTGLNAYNTPTAIIPAISPAISLQGRTPSRPSARPLRPRVPSRHFPDRARLRPPRPSSITPAPCRPLPDAAQRVLAVSHSEHAVRAGHVLRATRARRALALGACLWELPRQPASRARHHCRHRVPRARPPALAASPLVLTVWHDEHEYPAPLPSVPRDFLYNT